MMPAEATPQSLVASLSNLEDAAAWRTFSALYLPWIRAFFCRQGLQDADAADATQETLLAVAKSLPEFQYDPSRGSFRAWLLTISRSKLNNFFRKRKRDLCLFEHLNEIADPTEPTRESEASVRRQRMASLADAFSAICHEFQPATWEAFWLTAVEGKSGQAASRATGITVRAVYIAKSRVLKRVREYLLNRPSRFQSL